jgi:tetratricopeptide (TPR) repeat protein
MGTVYLAERADDQYKKRVALKLLRARSARDEHGIRRFREERQILAALDHSDIARLLDGGVTADGLPWFAMEYVEGVPIDRYCDERRLSVETRLELFCRVCAAVQYAHRNLVVHRDLKPANILVTADGGVKLLDFGIAKLLVDSAAGVPASLTATGERLMTPLYASPEQLRGDSVSTASDVYALGVLLYELLTGRVPYRLATREAHDVAAAILEQEPERMSAVAPAKLARRLRGDLDTIVATALQKDPGRRYASAEQLGADVRRHLDGLPVTARPDSGFYRARKFVRRHRVGVALAAGVALLVVGFGVVTAVQSLRIRVQAARIAAERDRAEEVSRFLAGLFQTADPFAGAGAGLTAREMLDSGAARIDRELAGQPETRAQMMLEMGRAYFGLGARDRARRFAEVALAVRRRVSPDARAEIADALDFVGLVRLEQGELDGAERAYGDALALRRRLLGAGHREVARTLNGLAGVLRSAGRFRQADSISRQAVAIDETQSAVRALDIAESLKGLALAVHERGGYAEAERLYRRALALERRELPGDHPQVVGTLLDLAATVGDADDLGTADSLFRQGLALQRAALGDEHPEVAGDQARYARLLHRRRKARDAEALYRRSLTTMRRQLPAVHPLTATTLLGLGTLLLDRGAAERAEPLLREALGMRRTALPSGHPGVVEAEQAMGAVIMARGRYMEAERYLLTSHEGLRTAYGEADTRTRGALTRLVQLYETSGQPARAATYRAQLEVQRPRPSTATDSIRTRGSTTVAVFPFQIRGADLSLSDLRDVLQDLIAARFTGEGGPRAVDPAAVRRDERDVSLRFAEQLGATWVLRGDISGTPDSLWLEATLVSVPGGAIHARARVYGMQDSLPHLADRLVVALLATQAARDSNELAALTGTSLPALQAYLGGREAYRRGRFRQAAETYFERALFLDTTFALSALSLAAISDLYGGADQRWHFDAAWRRRDKLSRADRAVLLAYLGPRYPGASTLAERIAAAEVAARAASSRWEAWFIAGENLQRFGSLVSHPGWEAQAVTAFERALALDSTHAETLDRLLVLAAGAGDRETVRRYARLYFDHNASAESADFVRWRTAVALDDHAALAEIRRRFSAMRDISLWRIMSWSHEHGVAVEDGDSAALTSLRRAVTMSQRRVALTRMVRALLNRGRPSEARRVLAESKIGFGLRQGVTLPDSRIYAAIYWDGDTTDAASAARQLEAYLSGASPGLPEALDRRAAGCALAHWRVAGGDFRGARTVLGQTRRVAAPTDPLTYPATPVCMAAAEALLAAHTGGSSAAAALARLDSLLLAVSSSRDVLYTVGNLIAARLYEARGDLPGALERVRRRTWWAAFLSTQLREEGRLAAMTGDTAGAIRAYRHYLALRSNPEPRLRADAQRVRAELERLDRGIRD